MIVFPRSLVISLTVGFPLWFSCPSLSATDQATDCERQLLFPELDGANTEDSRATLLLERYKVSDLFKPGAENLIGQAPHNLLTAAQRFYGLINSFGFSVGTYESGAVRSYSAFHKGLPEAGGKLIVGEEAAVSQLVEGIRRTAEMAPGVTLLAGPPGTGKSLTAEILAALLLDFTQNHREGRYYSFRIVGLDAITSLQTHALAQEGGTYSIFNPYGPESVMSIIPEVYRNHLIDTYRAQAEEFAGVEISDHWRISPYTKFVLDHLYAHYKATTPRDMLDVLERHVEVYPIILGGPENFVNLATAGPNFNVDEFFGGKNALYLIQGKDGPLSFSPGSLHKAQVVFLDEILRYDPAALDALFEYLQNQAISNAGSPKYVADVLLLLAGNYESMPRLQKERAALLDRMTPIDFLYSTNPNAIGAMVAFMLNGRLRAKPLMQEAPSNAGYSKVHPLVLSPRVDAGKQPLTPHGRYSLKISGTPLAPWTFEFLSALVAATRMITDPNVSFQSEIKKEAVYRDVVTRLRYFNGELPLTPADRSKLRAISAANGEGKSQGLPSRQIMGFIDKLVEHAKRPDHHGEIDWQVVMHTWEETVDAGGLTMSKDEIERSKRTWKLLAGKIVAEWLVPNISKDIQHAMTSDPKVESLYQRFIEWHLAVEDLKNEGEAIDELNQLDSSKLTYERADGSIDNINLDLYVKILAGYKKMSGRVFSTAVLNKYITLGGRIESSRSDSVSASERLVEPTLMRAVRDVLVYEMFGGADIYTQLLDYYEGRTNHDDVELIQAAQRFESVMMEKFGYSRGGIKRALSFVHKHRLEMSRNSKN